MSYIFPFSLGSCYFVFTEMEKYLSFSYINYFHQVQHFRRYIVIISALQAHINIIKMCTTKSSSSGSTVSDYGLDDRAIGVRSPAGAKGFFL
jgi:hypothetical protein